MSVPEAMQNRVLKRFPLRRRKIPVAGGAIDLVTPVSMDCLLEGEWLHHYDRAGYLPYWADVWPASVGVARWLMRGPALAGRRVLDLGCGVGLAGVAAARRGARVTFADVDPHALEFARFNAEHNGADQPEILRLDWFTQTAPPGFDLVLLADVAYEKMHYEPLLRHIERCVAPGGRALLGDPFREAASGFLGQVKRRFATEEVATDAWYDERRIQMRLCWIWPADAQGQAP